MVQCRRREKEDIFKYIFHGTIWKIEDTLKYFSLYNIDNEKKNTLKHIFYGVIWKIEDTLKYIFYGTMSKKRERRHI